MSRPEHIKAINRRYANWRKRVDKLLKLHCITREDLRKMRDEGHIKHLPAELQEAARRMPPSNRKQPPPRTLFAPGTKGVQQAKVAESPVQPTKAPVRRPPPRGQAPTPTQPQDLPRGVQRPPVDLLYRLLAERDPPANVDRLLLKEFLAMLGATGLWKLACRVSGLSVEVMKDHLDTGKHDLSAGRNTWQAALYRRKEQASGVVEGYAIKTILASSKTEVRSAVEALRLLNGKEYYPPQATTKINVAAAASATSTVEIGPELAEAYSSITPGELVEMRAMFAAGELTE